MRRNSKKVIKFRHKGKFETIIGALLVFKRIQDQSCAQDSSVGSWMFGRIEDLDITAEHSTVKIYGRTGQRSSGQALETCSLNLLDPKLSIGFEWQVCLALAKDGVWWPALVFKESIITVWLVALDQVDLLSFQVDCDATTSVPFDVGISTSRPSQPSELWLRSVKCTEEFLVHQATFLN